MTALTSNPMNAWPEFDDCAREAMRDKARPTIANKTEAYGHMSDEWVANRVRMLMRTDLEFEPVCSAGRDRIMRLSMEVAELRGILASRRADETEVPHILAAIARTDASPEAVPARDTGILDHFGQRILEGDRVRVDWTAELGITELSCTAIGTVVYMPDKITAAWFVKFDELYKRSVTEEGVYETDSQMLVQAREIGDECLIHFEKIGAEKSPAEGQS